MRDRFPLVIVGGLLLVGVLGAFLLQGARRGSFADRLSTFRSEPDGARALYLVLEAQHLEVTRSQQRLDLIEPGQPLLLLGARFATDRTEHKRAFDKSDAGMDDEDDDEEKEAFHDRGLSSLHATPLDEEERTKLLEHVRNGATVIYAPWGSRDNPFLDELDVSLITPDEKLGLRTLVPAQPSRFTAGVQTLEAPVQAFLDLPVGAVPLLVDGELEEVVAAALPWGQGRVIILGAPELATNRHLALADNARFWSSLVGALATHEHPLAFDEYHHGFKGDRSMGEFASRYGLQDAVGQLLFGLALWALALRRFGRPKAPTEALRVGATDALFATSRIYREGHHWAHAANAICRELALELAPRAGLAAHASTDELVAGLTRRGRADLAEALTQVTRAADTASADDDVRTVAKLAALARRQLHQPRGRLTP
jgi:hypothetical protein